MQCCRITFRHVRNPWGRIIFFMHGPGRITVCDEPAVLGRITLCDEPAVLGRITLCVEPVVLDRVTCFPVLVQII